MGSADIIHSMPLVRQNPWYPGQIGISGSSNELGLRTNPSASVFYVDPNHLNASDDNDGTDPEHPLVSIQEAHDKCEDYRGDEIRVGHNDAWTYSPKTTDYNTDIDEDVIITTHGIKITGVSNSPLGPTWKPATSGGIACLVRAMDVVIEGFCFMGNAGAAGGTAIYCDWNGTTAWGENTVVRHCYFDGDIDIGIQLEYAWNCHIYDNEFAMCDVAGIYCDPADSPMAYCRIKDNLFYDVGVGQSGAMAISEATNCEIKGNVIFNSVAQGAGAAANEGINTSAGAGGNIVAGNYFSCLLPVPANGDWDDLNSADVHDAWVGNWCMNGMAVTNPS